MDSSRLGSMCGHLGSMTHSHWGLALAQHGWKRVDRGDRRELASHGGPLGAGNPQTCWAWGGHVGGTASPKSAKLLKSPMFAHKWGRLSRWGGRKRLELSPDPGPQEPT